MRRFLNIALVLAMIAGAALTYNTKHDVEEATSALASLRLELGREKDALTMLRAEWSVLTQPARLQDLAARYNMYLNLEPFEPTRLVAVEDIPLRPITLAPPRTATAMSGPARSIDDIITGATR